MLEYVELHKQSIVQGYVISYIICMLIVFAKEVRDRSAIELVFIVPFFGFLASVVIPVVLLVMFLICKFLALVFLTAIGVG